MRSLSLNLMFTRLMFILGLLCAGCQSTIQMITPMIISSSTTEHVGELILSASVQNYSDATSPDLWLAVYSECWPNCTAAWCSAWPQVFPSPNTTGPPSSQNDCLHVGVLASNTGWAVPNYTIDHGTSQCMQNSCPGHLWLTLTVDPLCRQRLSGPSTGLHVNWAESGDISKQIISEF
jgi:hypothetical protein